MPFVGHDEVRLIKKRRRTDDDPSLYPHHDHYDAGREDASYNKLSQHFHQQQIPFSNKLSRIISPIKRTKLSSNSDVAEQRPTSIFGHRRRLSQQAVEKPLSALDPNTTSQHLKTPRSNPLTPCHICHRRPTKRSDLDSFAECEGCGGWTCFVCIRQCSGWNVADASALSEEQEMLSRSFHSMDEGEEDGSHAHNNASVSATDARPQQPQAPCAAYYTTTGTAPGKGWAANGHRAMVCSGCCVERGAAGEIVCFGCLPGLDEF